MKTLSKNCFRAVVSALLLYAPLSSWAGPFRNGIDDGEEMRGQRFPNSVLVSGQVLLHSGNFVIGLVGSPPPPPVGPFQASLRIYLRPGNEFIRKVRTDSQGKFSLRLAPGEYRIVPDIMQDNHAVGPGDAQGLIIIGRYEAAPALNISLKRNHPLAVTIAYQMLMGS